MADAETKKPDFETLARCMELADWKIHRLFLLHEPTGMIAEFKSDILLDPPALEACLTVYLPDRLRACKASRQAAGNRRNN